MTPTKWYSSDDLILLLQAVAGTVSERRLRLFTLACCESVTAPNSVTTFGRAINFLRQQTAGPFYPRAGRRLYEAIQAEREELAALPGAHLWCEAAELAICASLETRTVGLLVGTLLQASSDENLPPIALRRTRKYADLLREMIRSPGAELFQNGWRNETVCLLSDATHAERAYDRLPILADALEEARCDDAELLNHLRGPGPHVLGCWALDLVRGCY